MKPSKSLVVVTLICLVCTGCASTQSETARQLDAGDFTASASMTLPGAMVIPKFSGSARMGFSAGDIGGHLGTSFFTYSAGLSGRIYPSELLTLSLQTNLMLPMFLTDEEDIPNWSAVANPRISTSTNRDRFVYGGFEAPVTIPLGRQDLSIRGRPGIFGGFEFLFGNDWSAQVEFAFRPVDITETGDIRLLAGFIDDEFFTYTPVAQVTAGVHHHWFDEPREPEQLEPTRDQHFEPESEEPAPSTDPDPEPEPDEEEDVEPEPEYDDRGVPVY